MPNLIAHRGYSLRYPENTLLAIESAIGAGARHIEVDIQLSADGIPVVFHDDGLQRLCGVPGSITGCSIADIRRFRVNGEPVPTLSELTTCLRRHPDVHVFVELKQESIDVVGEAAVLAAAASTLQSVRPQCTLISFNAAVLRLAMAQGWSSGWVTEIWPETLPDGLEQGLDIWFCDVAGLPAYGQVNPLTVPLAVYEVSDPAMAHALVERGAAYIETNDIGGMRRALAGWT